MFEANKPRYMTKGIAEQLHPELQILLWEMIDARKEKGEEVDYLIVFELTVQEKQQFILQRQEQPPYKHRMLVQLRSAEPITSTIWCMDNGETQSMLYPEDY
jgi:hypothetical protein